MSIWLALFLVLIKSAIGLATWYITRRNYKKIIDKLSEENIQLNHNNDILTDEIKILKKQIKTLANRDNVSTSDRLSDGSF